MSKIAQVYLSDEDEKRLAVIAKELDRKESDLIDSAVSEAINDYWRSHRPLERDVNEDRLGFGLEPAETGP